MVIQVFIRKRDEVNEINFYGKAKKIGKEWAKRDFPLVVFCLPSPVVNIVTLHETNQFCTLYISLKLYLKAL